MNIFMRYATAALGSLAEFGGYNQRKAAVARRRPWALPTPAEVECLRKLAEAGGAVSEADPLCETCSAEFARLAEYGYVDSGSGWNATMSLTTKGKRYVVGPDAT